MTDHLSDEARLQLETLDTAARCAAIEAQRWIGYPAAMRALDALTQIRERPTSTRTAGVAVCGPFRNGKTMVADKFLSMETVQIRPSHYYQLPTAASPMEFLTGMIRAMGRVPDPTHRTIEGRRQQLESLLDEHEPRVFIFDDAHHGFRGSAAKDFHTLLRVMGHRWDMSPVLIGDRSLAEAIHNDGELRTRLANRPLRRKSDLTEEPLAKRIFLVAEGLIGDIVQNVAAAAVAAVRAGEERITVEIFDSLNLEPPSKRFSPDELRGLA
jgi:hypothetical protein